jgi:hypothetical protein
MKSILKNYKGELVAINCNKPAEKSIMELFIVEDEFFGVINPETNFKAYYPYYAILGVYESEEGFKNKSLFGFKKEGAICSLLINVNHFILYDGNLDLLDF